jgi:hypothetical protein
MRSTTPTSITVQAAVTDIYSAVLPLPKHQAWKDLEVNICQAGKVRKLTLHSR